MGDGASLIDVSIILQQGRSPARVSNQKLSKYQGMSGNLLYIEQPLQFVMIRLLLVKKSDPD